MRVSFPRSSPPLPALAWLVPAAAGLAIALSTTGCVGPAGLVEAGEDQEATDSYVRTTEAMCLRLLTAAPSSAASAARLSTAGKTEAEFVAGTRDGMINALDAIDRSARDMYGLRAPDQWSGYQRRVERTRPDLDRVLRESRAATLALSSYDDIIGLEPALVDARLGGPDRVETPVEYLPRDLVAKTPSCRQVRERTEKAEQTSPAESTGGASFGSPATSPVTNRDPGTTTYP